SMIQKIDRWGNSLGVRLPKQLTKQLSLSEGSAVVVTLEKNALMLRPQKRKDETLKQLLERITSDNLHDEVCWGEPQGKEIW
ncbi:AbrB/MazE/SpoVT family DNA-binding domain-containing protein, partial [Candidatus Uhrbacteria bacterium]|nr:AbrB/MazE/SpoVT family DNA-binding domain-containing protein [Candidatus Uhrbacteria bacterium]